MILPVVAVNATAAWPVNVSSPAVVVRAAALAPVRVSAPPLPDTSDAAAPVEDSSSALPEGVPSFPSASSTVPLESALSTTFLFAAFASMVT